MGLAIWLIYSRLRRWATRSANPSYVQLAKGALQLVLAAVLAFLAYESLSKLWGYDSPTWIYIAYGSVAALLALLCAAAGARSIRRS